MDSDAEARKEKALERFRLTKANRSAMQKAFMEIIDKQFDMFEQSYADVFKGLSVDVLESMTEKEAAGFMDIVVKEAIRSLEQSSAAFKESMKKTTSNKEVMDGLAESFMKSIGFDPSQKPNEVSFPGGDKE